SCLHTQTPAQKLFPRQQHRFSPLPLLIGKPGSVFVRVIVSTSPRHNLIFAPGAFMVDHASAVRSSSAVRGDEVAGFSATWRALRHRNFQLFFSGQLISLTGTWMQSVAQSWLVYRLTGSAILLGLVGFSSQIPVFLLAPLGGAAADRRNRLRILIATQSAAMILPL